jgi:hypothetical protein
VVRAKPKSKPQARTSPSQPSAGSTADMLDRKLESVGKSIGGTLKGLFGN